MIEVEVSYVCNLPIQGNCPRVMIKSGQDDIYDVDFINNDNGNVVFSGECETGDMILGARQWFTNWKIRINNKAGKIVFIDHFNATNKIVSIKIDAFALGDNIAWMPYIEEFRKKHNCKVICSTFFNGIFSRAYPDIVFVKPNTEIENLYAQYYVGANEEGNSIYSPVNSSKVPLQMVASSILGLDYKEIKTKLSTSSNKDKVKVVCISEHASDAKKGWKEEGGWQKVVDHIRSLGFEVAVISKEPTELERVIDLTGNISLIDRISQIEESVLFIGVSSGLSWLSWACNTHVMLISDVTPMWHEFQLGVTRLSKNPKQSVDYTPTEPTSLETVKEHLDKLLKQ